MSQWMRECYVTLYAILTNRPQNVLRQGTYLAPSHLVTVRAVSEIRFHRHTTPLSLATRSSLKSHSAQSQPTESPVRTAAAGQTLCPSNPPQTERRKGLSPLGLLFAVSRTDDFTRRQLLRIPVARRRKLTLFWVALYWLSKPAVDGLRQRFSIL